LRAYSAGYSKERLEPTIILVNSNLDAPEIYIYLFIYLSIYLLD